MNIQVDNPVSILNQDTSRNFLNTKSASDKFKVMQLYKKRIVNIEAIYIIEISNLGYLRIEVTIIWGKI